LTLSRPLPVPDHLKWLVGTYASCEPEPVRFRPASWRFAGRDGDLLESDEFTTSSSKHVGDRTVDVDHVQQACDAADADPARLRQAFVLVMAWGSGTSNTRSYRNTKAALDDSRLEATLHATALAARSPDLDHALTIAYGAWHVRGVGQAFFTKWFRFAGHVPDRTWDPLILDARVYATLNRTLGVSTRELTVETRRAARYAAYVGAMHLWAAELRVPADRLEWILFRHNGDPDPGRVVRR
jgi:hypothetical protein